MNANEFLTKAGKHMAARAATYDNPEGERSMMRTVEAFCAITGVEMTESHGWMFMAVLKMVRDNSKDEPHQDSLEDLVAYAALYGESRWKNLT